MNALGLSIWWMNAAFQNPIQSCRVKKTKLKGWVYKIHMFPFKQNNSFTWYDLKMCLSLSITLSLLEYWVIEDG